MFFLTLASPQAAKLRTAAATNINLIMDYLVGVLCSNCHHARALTRHKAIHLCQPFKVGQKPRLVAPIGCPCFGRPIRLHINEPLEAAKAAKIDYNVSGFAVPSV